MMNTYCWFALVGWVAGWVTGRAMKCESHRPWVDAVCGLLGALVVGYLALPLESAGNWGFLMVVIVAFLGGSALTWASHQVQHVFRRFHHHAH